LPDLNSDDVIIGCSPGWLRGIIMHREEENCTENLFTFYREGDYVEGKGKLRPPAQLVRQQTKRHGGLTDSIGLPSRVAGKFFRRCRSED